MSGIPHSLIEKLRHPNLQERSAAVFDLTSFDTADTLPLLIDALYHETDLLVREDITFAITRSGKAAVKRLIPLLQDPDAQVRHHAAHVLGKIASPLATEALRMALSDSDERVILKAAFALSQIGDPKAIPSLVQLLGHPNREIETSLITILESFGKASIPALAEACQNPRWQVRSHAIDILGVIGNDIAIPLLKTALEDSHWQVRFSAVVALKQYNVSAFIFEPLRKDLAPELRALALRLLENQ